MGWAIWSLIFFFLGIAAWDEIRAFETDDSFAQDARSLGAFAMPGEGELKYVQTGTATGVSVILFERVPNRRQWFTCKAPFPTNPVVVVNLQNRNLVTDLPNGGVEYSAVLPVRSHEERAQIVALSAAILANPPEHAELGSWRPGLADQRLFPLFAGIFTVITTGRDLATWVTASGTHSAIALWVVYSIWFGFSRLGGVERLRQFRDWFWAALGMGFAAAKDAWQNAGMAYEKYQDFCSILNDSLGLNWNEVQWAQVITTIIFGLFLIYWRRKAIWQSICETLGWERRGDASDDVTAGSGQPNLLRVSGSGVGFTPGSSGVIPPPPPPPPNSDILAALARLSDAQSRMMDRMSVIEKGRDAPTGADLATGAQTVESLNMRLDRFEELVRVGAGTAQPAQKGDPRDDVESVTPCVSARGSPSPSPKVPSSPLKSADNQILTSGIDTPATVASSGDLDVQAVVEELLRDNEDPQSLLLAELRRYKTVSKRDWRMPVGYSTRLTPRFLSHVYRGRRTAVEYAKEFIRSHGMENSPYGKELVRLAEHLDMLLLRDRVVGMINFISTEKLTRRMRGLEVSFEKVLTEEDWKRPRNAGKDWKPKTNWRACDAIDVSSVDPSRFRLEEMEKELQDEREKAALTAKAQMKLDSLNLAGSDPRDSGQG